MKKYLFPVVAAAVLLMGGCKSDKDEEPQPAAVSSSLAFKIGYQVDTKNLFFDSLMYVNDAGNPYSVYMLEYFLTEISLIKPDSSVLKIQSCQYIDAAVSSTSQFTISNIPDGNYIGIAFNIGVDSAHNVTGGLPNTINNNNMEWPEPMGGGYHFMKFEGHFVSNDTLYGFNMHLGMNENLVRIRLYSPVSFNHSPLVYSMKMNPNEWFRNPSVFDFNTDGNYTMGNDSAMHKLAVNGTDVFTRY